MPVANSTTEAVKHTPGPWNLTHRRIIERAVTIREHYAIAPSAGPTFAFLPSGRNEAAVEIQKANASLIAAAPDLLAACRFAKSVIEHNGVFETSERLAIEKLDAALAKAVGR